MAFNNTPAQSGVFYAQKMNRNHFVGFALATALTACAQVPVDDDESVYAVSAPFYLEDGRSVTFERLLKEPEVQAALSPAVKIYWDAQAAPDFIEESIVDTYTEVSPRHGLRPRCISAFAGTLAKITKTAQDAGFDSAVIYGGMEGDKPLPAGTMHCTGTLWTQTSLKAKLGLQQAPAKQIVAYAEPRQPAEGGMFLPIGKLSAEDIKLATANKHISWIGQTEPKFRVRFGPELYSEYADYRETGIPAACRKAFVAALAYINTYAEEYGHDAIIRVRSRLNDKFTPKQDEYECVQYDRKYVLVTLQAATAKTLP